MQEGPRPLAAAPPRRRSPWPYVVGFGCGGVVLVAAAIGGAIYLGVRAIGPGEEVASTAIAPGEPFVLDFTQRGGDEHDVWLELDVSYTSGLGLSGPLAVASNGEPLASHTLDMRGGQGAPIRGRSGSRRVGWVSSDVRGRGSARGKTYLFTIPRQRQGARITVSGTVEPAPGTTVARLRLFATD